MSGTEAGWLRGCVAREGLCEEPWRIGGSSPRRAYAVQDGAGEVLSWDERGGASCMVSVAGQTA